MAETKAIKDKLHELINVAWAAKASYEIYDTLTDEESKKFSEIISRYHEFFGATILAHTVRAIVSLGVLYDKRQDTNNLDTLLARLRKFGQIDLQTIKRLKQQIDENGSIEKLRTLRHTAVAHLSSSPPIKETRLIKQELHNLVEFTTGILVSIGGLLTGEVSFVVSNPPGEGTRALLIDFLDARNVAAKHPDEYIELVLARRAEAELKSGHSVSPKAFAKKHGLTKPSPLSTAP